MQGENNKLQYNQQHPVKLVLKSFFILDQTSYTIQQGENHKLQYTDQTRYKLVQINIHFND